MRNNNIKTKILKHLNDKYEVAKIQALLVSRITPNPITIKYDTKVNLLKELIDEIGNI